MGAGACVCGDGEWQKALELEEVEHDAVIEDFLELLGTMGREGPIGDHASESLGTEGREGPSPALNSVFSTCVGGEQGALELQRTIGRDSDESHVNSDESDGYNSVFST